ncbi:uncharacterized protein LOC118754979 [Rhagoletis pomonella]|uniref:uncharacterized protein LOC118754979 n=1 Tax=Rhagoletis pomonella TaxID=28610 RepID=UPI001782FBA0|nr:uncharacterized protein LOC118754979 [Rhagoletis pomonella]XP_036345736.1 uncharacterized protein LOC118754979 [Rhagoletis pomonella]
MSVVKYIGRTTDFRGKTLWEIVGNLRDSGVGRLVIRNKFQRYEEPCYMRILKVEVTPHDPEKDPIRTGPKRTKAKKWSYEKCLQKYCGSPNRLVERDLDLHLRAKRAKDCLRWGSLNVVLLAILLFDISNQCPYSYSKWYYVEYLAAALSGLGAFSCFLKYFLYLFHTNPLLGTKEQKNLLKFDECDSSFAVTPPAQRKSNHAMIWRLVKSATALLLKLHH